MSSLNLKPAHAPVKKYYATLQRFARGHFHEEGNIRGAFEDLLKHKKCPDKRAGGAVFISPTLQRGETDSQNSTRSPVGTAL